MICEKCKGSWMVEEYREMIGKILYINLIPCPECTGV